MSKDANLTIDVAVAIAAELGDDFDAAPWDKAEWIRERGMDPFRDVNRPFRKDYLAAARAAIEMVRKVSA